MVEPLRRHFLLTGVIVALLLAGGRSADAQSQTDQAPVLVVFELSKSTVESIELGAEEPDQKLIVVRIRLSDEGVAELRRLTSGNIGSGLLIQMPNGRQFGPNRIERALGGNRLGLVLPSDVARSLHDALN